MKCPICTNADLVMSERQGIEIDYCPNCRGVWLDRGELDKILEKAISSEKSETSPRQSQPVYQEQKHFGSHDYYKHRKKHWLSELFD
ncbi:MAG: zf-TFIIB domain-containing protein [Bacteroidia bacterium]|nr:zf-TFIIB domain-containing protein [Bacteroidia bacterium]